MTKMKLLYLSLILVPLFAVNCGGSAGPAGPAGAKGADGKAGARGEKGDSGEGRAIPGQPGADGKPGPQGPVGPSGKDGSDGKVGPQGPKGDSSRRILFWKVSEAAQFVETCESGLKKIPGLEKIPKRVAAHCECLFECAQVDFKDYSSYTKDAEAWWTAVKENKNTHWEFCKDWAKKHADPK